MLTRPCPAIVCLLMLMSSCAFAQTPPAALVAASSLAKDLSFPAQISGFSSFGNPRMALFKPEGPGPFPALVLMHQCAGLGNGVRFQNVSMLDWAKAAVARGYVALLLDSLGPRGVKTVCFGAQAGVNFARGAKDALQAAEHLRKLEYVDPKRIALAGYSWGAMVGVFASGKALASALSPGGRFDAAVSFYPGCFTIRPPSGASYEIVPSDIDRPLLVLMGEADTETPAAECVSKLEAAKAAGAPVEWHVYPQTTHCWDCRSLDGFSKIDVRGNRVSYRYDKDVTADSGRRMFEFFDKVWAAMK